MADEIPNLNLEESTADVVGGDKITVGNISESYAAIGAGAQVIVKNIQQAFSEIDETEKEIQVAERKLADAIQRKLSRYAMLTSEIISEERENPYKALLEYNLEDAPFFYGRTDAIADMLEKLRQNHLTILESDSGSGKTSLLQAGLASRLLANGNFPLYLRPYNLSPHQAIKKTFLPDYDTQPDLSRFRDAVMRLHGFLERVTYYLGGQSLFIFIDQFEEFFTVLDPEYRQQFVDQLRECIFSDLPARWVLSLRKEYLSELRIFEAINPFNNKYFLPTLKLEEAHEVIIQPAALKGVAYEDGLVDKILEDLRQESEGISPAQVQLVCYTIFEELADEKNPSLLTRDLYKKQRGRGEGLPGAQGILNNHLARVLDNELKRSERNVAGQILEALVNSKGQRTIVSESTLISSVKSDTADTITNIIEILHKNRLIRREFNEEDKPYYELTHDYLLVEIELDPETKARKAAQELLNQAIPGWEARGRLLSESDLQIVNALQGRAQFNDKETVVIYASSIGYGDEKNSKFWQNQLASNTVQTVLLTLAQSTRTFVRIEAARKLVDFHTEEAAIQLANLAVRDEISEAQEIATNVIAEANHKPAIKRIIELATEPTISNFAKASLVTICDFQPATFELIPSSLLQSIQRLVWRQRWQNHKHQIYAAAWRAALGGFWGFGIGVGLIIAFSGSNLSEMLNMFQIAPLFPLSLILGGIVITGTLGGLAVMGGGFAYTSISYLFDGFVKKWSWALSSIITGVFLGLSMLILVQFAASSGSRRYFEGFIAGFIVGAVVTSISLTPKRFKPSFQRIITIIISVLIFYLIGSTGLSLNAETIFLVFAGTTVGGGFFWALNSKAPKEPDRHRA